MRTTLVLSTGSNTQTLITMKLLKVDPEEVLTFTQTPTITTPSRTLRLINVSSENVAFKVKTTAPRAYLVRPSSGMLKPKGEQEIQIILQPHQSEAHTHRFLVQAVGIGNSADSISRDDWANFTKDQVQEQRLSVCIEQRDGDGKGGGAGGAAMDLSNDRPSTGVPEGSTDVTLKVKFDELYQYTAMLEKEKKKIEAELEELKGCKSGSSGDGIGKVTLIIAVFMAILAAYFAQGFGK